jgi:hypothetical protein
MDIINLIKQLFCKHKWSYSKPEEINVYDCLGELTYTTTESRFKRCIFCGKIKNYHSFLSGHSYI